MFQGRWKRHPCMPRISYGDCGLTDFGISLGADGVAPGFVLCPRR